MEVSFMEEKVLQKKKNGMAMLILFILLYIAAIVVIVIGANKGGGLGKVLIAAGTIYLVLGWIPFCGLTVLKPQEAVVLTLFGRYVGSLKGEGFYFVNPFCSTVNPAADTKLNQSGDVKAPAGKMMQLNGPENINAKNSSARKKISLKIMTLNNNRQKINDCLGNPVEIGIAVMWRVTDTAKAVFNVDNYKEYLSLQCDSALRNIVRIDRKSVV